MTPGMGLKLVNLSNSAKTSSEWAHGVLTLMPTLDDAHFCCVFDLSVYCISYVWQIGQNGK